MTPIQRRQIIAISAVVLVVAEAAWLHEAGVVDLKDWQPLIAALVALIAAGAAYKGATAKIDFDRDQAASEHKRRTLRVVLLLKIAARHVTAQVQLIRLVETIIFGKTVMAQVRRLQPPKALLDAWNDIDLVDETIAESAAGLQLQLDRLAQFLEAFDDAVAHADEVDSSWEQILKAHLDVLSAVASDLIGKLEASG
jgi:hypothetical protein